MTAPVADAVVRRAPVSAVVVALLIAAAATALHLALPGVGLLNNGDGYRVLDKAFVDRDVVSWSEPMAAGYPMIPLSETHLVRIVPDTLSGLMALALGLGAKAAGLSEVPIWLLTAIYNLAFWTGVAALWTQLGGPLARAALAAAALWVMIDPVCAGYFVSPFEEAAAIALFPLWASAYLAVARRGLAPGWLVAATVALIYAKPSFVVFALPCALMLTRERGRVRLALGVVLVVAIGLGVARNQARFGEFHAFNRVFNGIAYSAAGVSGWPERDFQSRLGVDAARVGLAGFSATGLPPKAAIAWPGTFWPDFVRIPDPEFRESLIDAGRGPAYLATLASTPSLAVKVPLEGWLTAMRADYRLDYVHGDEAGGMPTDLVRARFGLLVLPPALALGSAALALGLIAPAAVLVPVVVAPVLVVMADGYYEFEKHVFPFLVMGVFCLLLAAEMLASARARPPSRRAAV